MIYEATNPFTPSGLPPHSIEAEQCVIASLILLGNRPDADEARRLLGLLAPKAFYLPDHETLWHVLGDMIRHGQPVDEVLLKGELQKRGQFKEIGGDAYLAILLNTVPSASRWPYYAQIVRDNAHLRAIYKFSYAAARDALTGKVDAMQVTRRLRDQAELLIRRASSVIDRSGAAAEVEAEIRAEANGLRQNEPFPWPILTALARCLLPGSITLLGGDPGVGKTWLIIGAMLSWLKRGVPFSARMLEKPRRWHVRRALALMCGRIHVVNDEHVRQNAEWYQTVAGEFAETLDAFGECIHSNELATGTHISDMATWVEERANAGDRILIVDPITLAATGDQGWKDQEDFMVRAGKAVSRSGSSLILTTHPRSTDGKRSPTLDDFAGGRVFGRACDAALSLTKFAEWRRASVITNLVARDKRTIDTDRAIKIYKARDAAGEGLVIAMQFDPNSGQFTEHGVVEEWIRDEDQAETRLPF